MNEVLVWSICFASLAALVYLMTPIIVRFDQKYRAKPTLYPVVVAELSHAAAEYLGGCGQALEAESFSTVGYYSLSLNTANVHTYIGLFMNRANDVKAIVAAFYIKTEDGIKITTHTVEFITHWKDGVEISTNNNGSFGTFKHGLNQKTLRLPKIKSLHDLYVIHCQRLVLRGDSPIETLPALGLEVMTQENHLINAFEEQVSFGRLYLDRSANVYRPTWKGAYLMTWSQLPPMNYIRKLREKRKSTAALKELNASASGLRVY